MFFKCNIRILDCKLINFNWISNLCIPFPLKREEELMNRTDDDVINASIYTKQARSLLTVCCKSKIF